MALCLAAGAILLALRRQNATRIIHKVSTSGSGACMHMRVC